VDRGDAGHWLVRTKEQIEQHDRKQKEWEEACRAEADALATIHQQHEEGYGYP
jgi:hypothetical protein